MASSSRKSGIRLKSPFVGFASFLRAPFATNPDAVDADIAVYGVPFDEGSPFAFRATDDRPCSIFRRGWLESDKVVSLASILRSSIDGSKAAEFAM